MEAEGEGKNVLVFTELLTVSERSSLPSLLTTVGPPEAAGFRANAIGLPGLFGTVGLEQASEFDGSCCATLTSVVDGVSATDACDTSELDNC